MTSATLLGWLTPTIGLIMSVAFALVWSQKRSNVHVLLVSVAFGFMTATFVVSQLVDHLSSSFSVHCAMACLQPPSYWPRSPCVGGPNCLSTRYGLLLLPSPQHLAISQIAHLPTGHFVRYAIANGPIVLLFAYAAWSLHRGSRKNLASRLLFFTICASAVQFIVRPIVMHSIVGSAADITDLGSIYWAALNFSAAVCAMLLGLSMIALAVSDLFTEVEEKVHNRSLEWIENAARL